jgi:hypothetical protein
MVDPVCGSRNSTYGLIERVSLRGIRNQRIRGTDDPGRGDKRVFSRLWNIAIACEKGAGLISVSRDEIIATDYLAVVIPVTRDLPTQATDEILL